MRGRAGPRRQRGGGRQAERMTIMNEAKGGSRRIRLLVNFLAPFLGLLLVIIVFSLLPQVQDRFLRLGNLKSVATQSVIVALGALGMTFIIISGGGGPLAGPNQ